MPMRKTLIGISSLLASVAIMLFGHGLMNTLLSLRAVAEGYQESTIGMIMSMYFLGFVTGTFLCPRLIRNVGHIRALAALAAFCACVSILQGFWISVAGWSLMRFASGLCIVGIFMVIESWLNRQVSNDIRGRIFAIYVFINLCFMAASQFLLLAGDIRSLELFAIVGAMFSLCLVPVTLTRLPEPEPVQEVRPRIDSVYRTSPLGVAGCVLSGMTGSAFWALAPLFAERSGFGEYQIALFMSTTIFGGVVLQFPLGLWSDRTDRRVAIMLTGFTFAAASLLAMLSPEGPSLWMSACLFLLGGMMFSIYPLSVAHANDHPSVNDHLTLSTTLLLLHGIGAAFGPVTAGLLMHWFGHYSLMGYFTTTGLLLGGFAWYRRRHGVEISVGQQTSFVPLTRTSQVLTGSLYGDNQKTEGVKGD